MKGQSTAASQSAAGPSAPKPAAAAKKAKEPKEPKDPKAPKAPKTAQIPSEKKAKAPKAPKKAKSVSLEDHVDGKKPAKKMGRTFLGPAIRKLLRGTDPAIRISSQGRKCLNSMMKSLASRIGEKCVLLMNSRKRATLNKKIARDAINLVLPQGLSKFAQADCDKAWQAYLASSQ